jgi:hypothetical protein
VTKQHHHLAVRTTEVCACGAVRIDGGSWDEHHPDPAGQALVAKYLAVSTPEERSAKATLAAQARWRGTSAKERSEYMRWMAQQPRPGRRIAERCPCGRYSVDLAQRRGHRCQAMKTEN